MATRQNFKIRGVIKHIGEREVKSEKLTIRQCILHVEDGAYPQTPVFQFSNDRCDILDGFGEGQDVTIHFAIQGREWQGRYFNTLAAWKIEGNVLQDAPAQAAEPVAAIVDEPDENSLPF